MKILGLRLYNLNSLSGEHQVRFDRSPFLENGLFAITGATGSGKTTLLDAITLALYGRVHRHGPKNAFQMMSRHTSSCYAEADFEVKGRLYRAKWSLRRTGKKVDGENYDEKMEMADLELNCFLGGHTLTSIKQAVVDLCGLDYNQFLRSVLLCQGDFTRFLKASDTDRSELLEKLTDTGIYSQISIRVHRRLTEEQAKQLALQTEQSTLNPLGAEDRDRLTSRLSEILQRKLDLAEQQRNLTVQLNWLSELEMLRTRESGYREQLAELDYAYADQPLFKDLPLYLKAKKWFPLLTELTSVRESLTVKTLKLDQFIRQYFNTLAGKEKLHLKVEKSLADCKNAETKLESDETLLAEVTQLDARLEHEKRRLSHLKEENAEERCVLNKRTHVRDSLHQTLNQKNTDLDQKAHWLALHQGAPKLEKSRPLIERLLADLKDVRGDRQAETNRYLQDQSFLTEDLLKLEAAIEKDFLEKDNWEKIVESLEIELEAQPSFFKLESRLSFLNQELKIINTLSRTGNDLAKRSAEVSDFNARITLKQEQGAVLAARLKSIQARYDAEKEKLIALGRIAILGEKVAGYERERATLETGEPCPLCGSTTHPFAEMKLNAALESRKAADDQAQITDRLYDEASRVNADLNTCAALLASFSDDRLRLDATCRSLEQQLGRANETLSKPLLQMGMQDIDSLHLAQLTAIEEVEISIANLREMHAACSDTRSTLADIQLRLSTSEGSKSLIKSQLIGLAEKIEAGEREARQEQVKVAGIQVQLQEIYTRCSFTPPPDVETVLSAVDQEITLYQNVVVQLEATRDQKRTVESELATTGELIEAQTASLDKREMLITHLEDEITLLGTERYSVFQEKNPNEERSLNRLALKVAQEDQQANQELLREQSQNLSICLNQIKTLKDDVLASRAAALGLEAVSASLQIEQGVTIREAEHFMTRADVYENALTEEKRLLEQITVATQLAGTCREEWEEKQQKELTAFSSTELSAMLDAGTTELAKLNQETGSTEQSLSADDQLRSAFAELLDRAHLQELELARWSRLHALIGSHDGKKFSKFAQRLTLTLVAQLANTHLKNFTDRYQILKSAKDDLELAIVDTYQADSIRTTATLSGGESFLVSLALALGLSDLASHKVEIGSLFIDEGFGTLDAETLDMALSALERLQSQGKSIGVISHMEALQERISTQIRVTKRPGGHSILNIYNSGYLSKLPA